MTEEEMKEHARRIAKDWLQASEYSNVYEDDEIPVEATEDDMLAIHKLIVTADALID